MVKEKINNLPEKPGVYMMKNKNGEVIYIGKARNLKKRVSSYFTKASRDGKTENLVNSIGDIEVFITDNEIEAFLLESNLIKKYRPKYNIVLKDNERYPYIKITNERFPRIMKTRIREDDGSIYFGPYPNVKYINHTIKTITDLFPIRRCSRASSSAPIKNPCLNYYIGKCICPLLTPEKESEYKRLVNQAVLFLKGRKADVLKEIETEMGKEAKNLQFEKAIQLRERYMAIKNILKEQKVFSSSAENEDIMGIADEGNLCVITLIMKRSGKIIGKKSYTFEIEIGLEEILEQFLTNYYLTSDDIPDKIILPMDIQEKELLEISISEKSGKQVFLEIPERGQKKRLVDMAIKNAQNSLREHLFRYNPEKAAIELKKILNLDREPKIIEGFDVATILGSFSVASMVNFINGIPNKKSYRKFRIKYVEGQNDVEMLKEAVARRYQRLKNEKGKMPDLVLVDGGKAQLNAAIEVMEKLDLENIPVVALAKSREQIYTRNREEPIQLPFNNDALRLLMAVRNEAHRFANTYHISLRDKNLLLSRISEVKGIGKETAKKFLSALKDINGPITAEELEKIDGIGRKKAQIIMDTLLKK